MKTRNYFVLAAEYILVLSLRKAQCGKRIRGDAMKLMLHAVNFYSTSFFIVLLGQDIFF